MDNYEQMKAQLAQEICERLKQGEYDETYQMIGNILFSDNPILFQKIADTWLRYYYIILEITQCEKKRQAGKLTADKYSDWRVFEPVLRLFKFAIRRIRYGFPQAVQTQLVELIDQYAVSPEFVVVVSKYTVPLKYLTSLLMRIAQIVENAFGREGTLLKGGIDSAHFAAVVRAYAAAFAKGAAQNLDIAPVDDSEENALRIICLDADGNGEHYESAGSGERSELSSERTAGAVSKEIQEGVQNGTDTKYLAYIMCANEEQYVAEAARYLRRQRLPKAVRANLYVVYHAPSMAYGYNLAMEQANADYYIYLHQDTFVFDREYTKGLLDALDEQNYALLGVAGTRQLASSGVWWEGAEEQKQFALEQDYVLNVPASYTGDAGQYCSEVQILDGVLLATDRKVPWRADLFTHFHFYDISCAFEYARRGLKAAVYYNGAPGVLHEVSVARNPAAEAKYEEARQRLVKEYFTETQGI